MSYTNKIKKYLKDHNMWEDSDAILVNEIEFNLAVISESKADVLETGNMIERGTTDNRYYVKNPSLDIYQMALRNVHQLFQSLILSPKERKKLQMEIMKNLESQDEFSEIFN